MKIASWMAMTIILLASCTQVPQSAQPTYNAEAAAALAQVTQAAATRSSNATATQIAATANAIHAEQTQQASYATATQDAEYAQQTAEAFYVTATAAMTATWQAEETAVHVPISVKQTSDAHALLMEREALNTLATATAVKRRIEKDEAVATRNEYLGYVFVGFVATCLGSISLFVFGKAWRVWRPVEAVYNDNGDVVGMDRTHYIEVRVPRHALPSPQAEPQQPAPPISNMSPTRPVTINKNGTSTTIPVNDKNGARPETWRQLAIALLVYQCNFSRTAVLDQTDYPAWSYGAMSQPEYNKAHQFLSNENMIEGRGEAQQLNGKGYDYLSKFIPNNLEINLPHPERDYSVTEDAN